MRSRTSITLSLLGAIVLAGVLATTWTATSASTEAGAQGPATRCQDSGARCLTSLRNDVLQATTKDAKLSWPIARLAEEERKAQAEGRSLQGLSSDSLPKALRDLTTAGLMRLDDIGDVQVFLKTQGNASEIVAELEATGVRIERVAEEQDIVQAWLPFDEIDTVAAMANVKQIRLPDYGFTQAGSVTTAGDTILGAAAARSAHGIDGSGIRVGVISDGVEGLAASQSSGDLPAVNTTTCNEVSESPTSAGAGAEGTAMLEIVHDLAPGG